MRRRERKGRRKRELSEGSYLGHAVKNRMTVISRWSAIILPKPRGAAQGILEQEIPAIYYSRCSVFFINKSIIFRIIKRNFSHCG